MDETILLSDVEAIIKVSSNLRSNIQFADEVSDYEVKALSLFESQLDIAKTIEDLVKDKKFVDAFILNRTIFENYFLIALILKGTKYVLRYKISAKPKESIRKPYDELASRLKKLQTEGRKDIISFRPVDKYKQIEICYQGLFSKEGDRLIPMYYVVFEEYDPIRHRADKFPSIATKQIFTDHVAKRQKEQEKIYETYFGFENNLKACVLNGLITEEEKIHAKVHYNFLSGFTHLTHLGFNLTQSFDWTRNKHYLFELNLLYVTALLKLYLLLLADFFSKTNHEVKNADELHSFLNEISRKYDYFWFIFNGPTEYDIWSYETVKEMRRREGKPVDETVPYCRDPFKRLVAQHNTRLEISTGQFYNSPWPPHAVDSRPFL
jgi:hypothetical protein